MDKVQVIAQVREGKTDAFGEIVEVVIRAVTYSSEWITTNELVKIAESIVHTHLE